MKISLLKFALLSLVLLLSITQAQAGLIKKTIQAEGTGHNLNQAIYDALDEAVGRINGKSIETRKQLNSVEISQVDNEREDYYAAESVQQNIKTATKGVVDGYEILSKEKAENGLWIVNLSVTVVKFQARESSRRRIAVFPLRIGQGSFLFNGNAADGERLGRIATQNLASTLVQSRRFTVLDREYISETLGEQGLALSPNTAVAEMARLGQEMVADYILVGTLEDIGYSEKKVKMQASGRELISRQGQAELSIRLVDVSTREIVFSDFLKVRVSEDDLERFGASLRDEGPASGIAIVAADRIGRKILETIYPLAIVSVNGKNVTLGQGGSQVKEGDRLEIFMYGESLVDPYTKEFIGREEIRAGMLEVVRVNPKQTLARVVESNIDIAAQFQPKKFICRAVMESAGSKETAREERRKKRETRRKERDKDW